MAEQPSTSPLPPSTSTSQGDHPAATEQPTPPSTSDSTPQPCSTQPLATDSQCTNPAQPPATQQLETPADQPADTGVEPQAIPEAPPYIDPELELSQVISQAQLELSALHMTQLSPEELEAQALEEALMMHHMSQGATMTTGLTAAAATGSLLPGQGLLAPGRSVSPHAALHGAMSPAERIAQGAALGLQQEGGGEVRVETEVQRYQARIKRTVARDIEKMLHSTRGYVQYHSLPPRMSAQQLCALSRPKPGVMHPDTALALLETQADYSEYARRKTAALQEERERCEAQQQEAAQQAQVLQEQLHHYRGWKGQREQLKARILAEEARVQREYGRQMSKYVTHKAVVELAEIKARRVASKGQ